MRGPDDEADARLPIPAFPYGDLWDDLVLAAGHPAFGGEGVRGLVLAKLAC